MTAADEYDMLLGVLRGSAEDERPGIVSRMDALWQRMSERERRAANRKAVRR